MTIIVLWILLGILAFIVILLHFSITVEISGSTDGKFDFKVKYMGFTVYPRPPKKAKTKSKKVKTSKTQNLPVKQDDIFTDSLDEELEDFVHKTDDETLSAEEEQEKADKLLAQIKAEKVKTVAEEQAETDKVEVKAEITDTENPAKQTTKAEKPKSEKVKKERPHKDKKSKKSDSKLDGLKEKYNFIKPYIPMGWKYFKKLLKAVRFLKVKINLTVGKEDAYECAMFYGKIQAALFNLLGAISGIFTVKIKEANVNCVFNEKRFDAEGETKICVRPSTMIAIAFCLLVSFLCKFLPKYFSSKKKRKKKIKEVTNETDSSKTAA